jgi:hypothetical protein
MFEQLLLNKNKNVTVLYTNSENTDSGQLNTALAESEASRLVAGAHLDARARELFAALHWYCTHACMGPGHARKVSCCLPVRTAAQSYPNPWNLRSSLPLHAMREGANGGTCGERSGGCLAQVVLQRSSCSRPCPCFILGGHWPRIHMHF